MSDIHTIPEVTYEAELPVMDREQIDMLLMVDDGEDSTKLVKELFDLFRTESIEKMKPLENVCEAGDRGEMRKIVHFVAGSAGNLGLARLSAFYRAIEYAIDHGELVRIGHCAQPIRAAFESSCVAFTSEFDI